MFAETVNYLYILGEGPLDNVWPNVPSLVPNRMLMSPIFLGSPEGHQRSGGQLPYHSQRTALYTCSCIIYRVETVMVLVKVTQFPEGQKGRGWERAGLVS